MKFSQIKTYALESTGLSEIESMDTDSIIDTGSYGVEINAAIETVNIAYRDATTLSKLSSFVTENANLSTSTLKLANTSLKAIAKRYSLGSVAQEGIIDGIGKALAAILEFIINTLKAIGNKIANLFNFSKDRATAAERIDSEVDELDEKYKELISNTEFRKKLDEEEYMLHKDYLAFFKKNELRFKYQFNFGITEVKIGALKKKHAQLLQIFTGLSSEVKEVEKKVGYIGKNIGDSIASRTSMEFAEQSFKEFLEVITNSVRTLSNDNGESNYTTVLPSGTKVLVNLDLSNNDFTVKQEHTTLDGVTACAVGRPEFNSLANMVTSFSFEDAAKDISDLITKMEAVSSGMLTKVNNLDPENEGQARKLAMGFSKLVLGYTRYITAIITNCISYDSNIMGFIKTGNALTKKFLKEPFYKEDAATESLDDNTFKTEDDVTFQAESIMGVASEAYADFDVAIEALYNNKNFVKTDSIEMSLEGYLDMLGDKYSQYASLEAADVESNESSEFSNKVARTVRRIIDFFINVIKAIRDRLYSFFGISVKTSEASKKNMKVLKEKVNENESKLKDKEFTSTIIKSKDADNEEAKEYIRTGKFTLSINSERFSLGKDINIKDLMGFIGEYYTGLINSRKYMAFMIGLQDGLSDGFTNLLEHDEQPTLKYLEDILAQVTANVESTVVNLKSPVTSPNSNDLAIAKFGETYLVARHKDDNIYEYPTPRPIKTDKFEPETTIVFSKGEVAELLSKGDEILKKTDDFIDTTKRVTNDLTYQIKNFTETWEMLVKNKVIQPEGVEIINKMANYMGKSLTALGKLSTYQDSIRLYLMSIIERVVKKETSILNVKN